VPCAGKSLGDSSQKPQGCADSALRYRARSPSALRYRARSPSALRYRARSPSNRLCRFFLGRRGGGLGLLRQLGEGSSVEHSHIGQDLAVETYSGGLQAVY
jgi:hypothetical protein